MSYIIAYRCDFSPLPLIEYLKTQSRIHKYIFMEEVSDKVKKLHHHGLLHVETKYTLKSEIAHFRAAVCKVYPDLLITKTTEGKKTFVNSHMYYITECRDELKYAIYSSKHLDIIAKHGYTASEIEYIITETKRINKEKNTKMKIQLHDYFKKSQFGDMTTLCEDIQYPIYKYHVDRDYLPPSKTLLTQYTGYVVEKHESIPEELKYNMFKQLYGIQYS